MEAQHTKAAAFLRHKGPFDRLCDQVAHRLTERQPMPFGVGFCHLDGIVLELKRRSRHVSIIS